MRKPLLFGLIAVIVVLLGAAFALFQNNRRTTAQYEEMRVVAESAQSRYDEAFTAIAEIQDSLAAIPLGTTDVQLLSDQLQAEQSLGSPRGHEALERIGQLKAGIERTKTRIVELEDKVKESGVKASGLQRMIRNLRRSVSEKEQLIAGLTSKVDTLETQVTGLVAEVRQTQDTLTLREQTLKATQRELGTVHFVIGTKKQLSTWGVIEARGGVLGLGRTLKPTGRYDEGLFTPLDTDMSSVIRTGSSKAQVLSAQPAASYELRDAAGNMELHILDPLEFRKIKHVIIMTS